MPYVGDKLAPLFDSAPLLRANRRLVDAGGDELQARIEENTPVDTRELRTSWYRTASYPWHGGVRLEWRTEVRTEVDYAPHVEWGTGIYGPKGSPYPIEPKRPGGMLSWVDEETGKRIYATRVMHPGSPGQHMVAIGTAMTEHTFEQIATPILRRWAAEQEARRG